MKKIGFILDSFACINAEKAKEINVGFFPFQCDIDKKVYEDGVDMQAKDLLQIIASGKDVKTSLPRLSVIENTITTMTKEYDEVIYLPIGQKLSSAGEVAKKYENDHSNFHVVFNTWVGEQYLHVLEYAKKFWEKQQDIKLLIDELKNISKKSLTYILPFSLNYAIKGGRVPTMKKFVLKTMSLMKLYPYVKYYDGSTSTGGLARTIKGAVKQMIEKLSNFAKTTIKQINKENYLQFIYGTNDIKNSEIETLVKDQEVNIDDKQINTAVIAIHTGPDAIALSIMPKLN